MNELLPIYVLYRLSKLGKTPTNKSEKALIEFLRDNSDDPEALKAASEFGESQDEILADPDFNNYIKNLSDTPNMRIGGKLEYLKRLHKNNLNVDFFKKGGKASKKCACGCNIITLKDKGGKMIEKCACGCKPDKKEDGGTLFNNIPNVFTLKNKQEPMKFNPKTESFKVGGKISEILKCGGKAKKKKEDGGKVEKAKDGTKVKPTTADSVGKYNRMHPNADGYGPKNENGKELKNPKEIIKAARKEWKGKKVDVTKSKDGSKLPYVEKMQKLNLKKKK